MSETDDIKKIKSAMIVSNDDAVLCIVSLPELVEFKALGFDETYGVYLQDNNDENYYLCGDNKIDSNLYDVESSKENCRVQILNEKNEFVKEYEIEMLQRRFALSFGV